MSQHQKIVEPHGGTLVDRFVTGQEGAVLVARAQELPRILLDSRELSDLELIATGAASPLVGFLGRTDYQSVLGSLRLADGTVWPLPLTLAVPEGVRRTLSGADEAGLWDEQGRLWGTVGIGELYERDPLEEARAVYGTDRPEHPGVAYLLSRPRWLVGGPVRVRPLPATLPFASHRLTPAALREEIRARDWRTVAGFQTRNPIHRAHEHLTKLALEITDGLVIHPLVGETKQDDVPASVRFQVYEMLVRNFYPKQRTLLAAFPAAMRYAGPREALFHALVRKNYGITHFIVGRDHAGVGSFYGPLDAQKIFDRFRPEELNVTPLRFDPTFYCRRCASLASARTCPHEPGARFELSGTKVREILSSGGHLPIQFTRRETAEILRSHYAKGSGKERPAAPRPLRADSGFILWLTGLSGAGKSTLAERLRSELEEASRTVEVLDGDEVRTYLSKGLGFSREDRDTNIGRIAYVARLLARNGVAVITAAISPYRHAREEARELAKRSGVPFVEVFVTAELETLVQRDVKGLYKKALAGEIANFTGVSDPYEAPERAEVVVDTGRETVEESAGRILGHLAETGLLPGWESERVA